MLTLKFPQGYKPERRYITKILLEDFIGLDYQIEFQYRKDVSITSSDGRELCLPDILFQTPKDQWLKPLSLPKQPLKVWDTGNSILDCTLVDPKVPIIYGIVPSDSQIINLLPIDIFGSAFFMLSRYEELTKKVRDEYGRFPASASLAFQEDFLQRPIVNEYLEIFWWALKKLWPRIKRKKRNFRILPTHDVDAPYNLALLEKKAKFIRRISADLLKRRNLHLTFSNLDYCWKMIYKKEHDPFDTFKWIMAQSEKLGLTSAFYFMGQKSEINPSDYRIDHPLLQKIIKAIVDRGHEIGFHPSYAAGLDNEIWKSEFNVLKKHCQNARIKGGRQHFLLFRNPQTWRAWEKSGLKYDSSVGFADVPGFRCGICYEYAVFDLEKRKNFSLRERPLVIMESTLLDKKYMGLGAGYQSRELLLKLKERCLLFNGDFTFVWHNHRLVNPNEIELYKWTISELN